MKGYVPAKKTEERKADRQTVEQYLGKQKRRQGLIKSVSLGAKERETIPGPMPGMFHLSHF